MKNISHTLSSYRLVLLAIISLSLLFIYSQAAQAAIVVGAPANILRGATVNLDLVQTNLPAGCMRSISPIYSNKIGDNVATAWRGNVIGDANVSLTFYATGTYTFRCISVPDPAVGGTATITIRDCSTAGMGWDNATKQCVGNTPPVAEAGNEVINITLPQTWASPINASAGDPDSDPYTILWVQVSGPVNDTIVDATSTSPRFEGLTAPGVYVFELQVTDSKGSKVTDTVTIVVNPAGAFSCTGLLPVKASIYAGDETPAVDTPLVYHPTGTGDMCEFYCDPGYTWFGGACVLPDIMAVNTMPTKTFTGTEDITFTGRAVNNTAVAIPNAGWAGVEIDWGRDGSSDYVAINENAGALGAFGASETRNITATVLGAVTPIGLHRYRFNVDSTGVFSESNESNNRATPWTDFAVQLPFPGTPPNLVVNNPLASCGGQINLDWDAASDAVTYEISLDGGATWPYVGINATNNTISGLPVNNNYNNSIRVAGRNATGRSQNPAVGSGVSSDMCRILTGEALPAPHTLPGCEIANGANSCNMNLSWNVTGATPAVNIYNNSILPIAIIANGSNIPPIGGTVTQLQRSTAFGNHLTGVNKLEAIHNDLADPRVEEQDFLATCQADHFFNPTAGQDKCMPDPTITVTVEPVSKTVRYGEPATITADIVTNGFDLRCEYYGAGLVGFDYDDANPVPDVQTTIGLKAAQDIELSCAPAGFVPGDPGVPTFTETTRINVIPQVEEN